MNGRDHAEALRALAALLRAGLTPRGAVASWHQDAPEALRPALRGAARRVALGDEAAAALGRLDDHMGPDAGALAALFYLHAAVGADLPGMLDSFAAAIDARSDAASSAASATAGAVLSARVVAGLPVLLIALSPMASAPLLDAAGVAMLASGAAFALGGLVWMSKLVPRPPLADDTATAAAEMVAAGLAGGAPFDAVLDAVADVVTGSGGAELARARRRVALGASWQSALARSEDEGLAALAAVIGRAAELGTPVARVLSAFASARRAAAARDFEAQTRRAPVVMAAPLSLCILPSYALLGLGPYLRSLSLGG